ncbi:MAG TPA: biotin carboxylase N-terminal domain-containing protein [Steroidobacteraceae bacterium]
MMESLLIANRGEIARRIIRTARRLGVRTIAVYSTADEHAPFVQEADEAIAIGAPPARESYLDGERILAAAVATRAAAIHPGYGFVSENAAFAEAVQAAGLLWVGAPPAAIRAMGLKDAAKRLMMQVGVPVTPGYLGEDQSPAHLKREAAALGYPILIKAIAGGGGRGMRRVAAPEHFAEALAACRREAAGAFGEDRVLLERYISSPRHLEVQVFGDCHGQLVHLFERDCSLQRRHQKVIEEAPAPGISTAIRAFLCDTAIKAAGAVNYVGAGTVEFIADASRGLDADRLWFMEMNTRLQVEHPVTEAITGQDLVEWQLRIACGERLPRRQKELQIHGCAMEARLYAENPSTGFLPSTGALLHLVLPTNIRVDSAVEPGEEVTGFYDSLLAKLTVHASTRAAAARQLAQACESVEVWPVHTNAAFLARVARHPAFIAGELDTGFIERHGADLLPAAAPAPDIIAAAAGALTRHARSDPWHALVGFRTNAAPYLQVCVAIGDEAHTVAIETPRHPASVVSVAGEQVLFVRGEAWRFGTPTSGHGGGTESHGDGSVHAPMPGRVVSVAARQGQSVQKGQSLLILEAMKMELALQAPFDGFITTLAVAAGDQVTEGAVLVRVAKEL